MSARRFNYLLCVCEMIIPEVLVFFFTIRNNSDACPCLVNVLVDGIVKVNVFKI